MNLTTRTRVLAMLEISQALPSTATLNSYLDNIISDWSRRAENVMDRHVETTERTVYLDVAPRQRVFSLKAFPVSAVSYAISDSNREFTGTTIASDDYSCQTAAGLLRIDNYQADPGVGTLKVVYTGGMGESVATFVNNYPDIAGAMDQQCAYVFHRKSSLGRTSISVGPTNVQFQGAVDWLPSVRDVLIQHRRVTLG